MAISHARRERSTTTNTWLNLLGRILLPLGLFAIALFGAGVNAAHASPDNKVASDLRSVLNGGTKQKWSADTSSGKYVQVVVSAESSDPALTNLRSAILAAGG